MNLYYLYEDLRFDPLLHILSKKRKIVIVQLTIFLFSIEYQIKYSQKCVYIYIFVKLQI